MKRLNRLLALLLLTLSCGRVNGPSDENGWRPLNNGLPENTTVKALAADASGALLLAGTVDGVFSLSGSAWQQAGSGMDARDVSALAVHPQNSALLFAGTWGKGLYRSEDGGKSWCSVWRSDMNPLINAVVIGGDGRVWAATEQGLFVSGDNGASWRAAFSFGKIYTVAVHPQNPRRVYFGARWNGNFRSDDGGETWQPINSGVYASGQEIAAAQSILFFNDHPDHLLMSTDYTGVYESRDAGGSWRSLGAVGFSEALVKLAADEQNGRVFGVGRNGGFYLSRDGGKSWSPVADGLNDVKAKTVLTLPQKARVLLGTVGSGIYQLAE